MDLLRTQAKKLLICFIILTLIAIASCSAPSKSSEPLLPRGFNSAAIPDIDMEGYIYLNQSTPVTVSANVLPGTSTGFGVDSASIWLGPGIKGAGGVVELTDMTAAQSLAQQISSTDKNLWTNIKGKTLYLTSGSGDWTASLQSAITGQNMTALGDKYPDIQENFNHFPANPPAKPVAAGFLRLDGKLIESIGSEANIPFADIAPVLQSARINSISFVLYGQSAIEITESSGEDFLQELGLGAIIVGRSGYPSFLIGFFFDRAAQGAGLEKDAVEDINIYSYPVAGMTVLVAREGDILYGAIAQSRQIAEQLLLSALQ